MKHWIALLAMAVIISVTGVATPAAADPADDREFSYGISVENKTFYPLVVDGFRDKAKVVIDQYDMYWRVRANVFTEGGRLIRALHVAYKCDRECEWSWYEAVWNGKKDDGTFARKGTYRIEVTAMADLQNDDGQWVEGPVTASRTVTLAGGYMDRRFAERRAGSNTSSRSHGNGCYTDTYRRTLELACWDGTYAKASWRLKIPANATEVRKVLWGPSGWDHGGKLVMTGKRINATTYIITAKVTRWRQEWFDSVEVRYTARVRV